MKIGEVNITYPNYFRVNISRCTEGVYLRWWYNGWHYYNFTNGYDISMSSESMDTQITQMFSVISRIEHPTKLKAEYSYKINIDCIHPQNVAGFTGLLMAEKVEQYEDSVWREVEITRGSHIIREDNSPGYRLEFEITRKELPDKSSVYQKSLYLYIGDTLCDLDEDEVIPVNKQTNDIAELKDRQSDFTATFKIRKTRAMRTLFELSGEVSSSTTFPYLNQTCKLIQDGIEMITHGHLILDLVDDQYYHCSIYSGNLSLFTLIGNLKITDIQPLTSPDQLDHYWDIDTMSLHSISPEHDFCYPMLEPSDDAGMNPMLLSGNTTELYGGWIWPFVKVSVLWNELFTNAAYTVAGNILNDDTFNRLYIPIASRNVNKAFLNKYLYSLYWIGDAHYTGLQRFEEVDTVVINGDANFGLGFYKANFTATYKFRIEVQVAGGVPDIRLYSNWVNRGSFTLTGTSPLTYEIEYAATIGEWLTFYSATLIVNYLGYSISVVEISDAKLEYGNYVMPRFNLPDMTQVDFIKMICNMFALIPEVSAKDMTVKFWNYSELYDNIALARDWSAYLSEREDETEFKFGDYAQYNYLKYKESDDVLKDNGTGIMIVDDETLTLQKDALELSISTCDEVTIAFTDPVATSRIAFNDWYDDAGLYKANDTIDPRIVYVKEATGKELILWDEIDDVGVPDISHIGYPTGNHVHIPDPLMATSIDIDFSTLVYHYGSLSRMLTKTNLRRCKFNLPVYEVAGLKHYIPIYLSQYQAYFYVNKINNYVPGKLCIIDLIKL
jgi:hypothetical protein